MGNVSSLPQRIEQFQGTSSAPAPAPAPGPARAPAPAPGPARAPAPAPGPAPVVIPPNLDILTEVNRDKIAPDTDKIELKNYYQYQTGSGAIFHDEMAMKSIPNFKQLFNNAFKMTNVYLEESPETDMQKYIVAADLAGWLQRNYDFCVGIRRPEDIPDEYPANLIPVKKGVRYGCGWYYHSAQSRISVAAFGTSAGPHPLITGLTGGEWIWNKQEAIKKESIKRCAAITVCGHIDASEGCGYCTASGRGIPYDKTTGLPLFPTDAGCSGVGARVITVPSQCPTGGASDICTTATSAVDRKACILQVMDAVQITTGCLRKYVQSTTTTATMTPSEKIIIEKMLTTLYFNGRFVSADRITPAELQGTTAIVSGTFRSKLKKLKILADTPYPKNASINHKFVIDMARALIYEDMAYIDTLQDAYFTLFGSNATGTPAESKDIAIAKLQTEFLKAGCQKAGSAFPTNLTDDSVVGKSLPELRTAYNRMYSDMKNAGLVSMQEEAVRKCLNAGVFGPSAVSAGPNAAAAQERMGAGTFCNERGIEYFVYEGRYNDGRPITLIGRIVSRVGLLKDPNIEKGMRMVYGQEQDLKNLLLSAENPMVSYRMRTMVSVPAGFNNTSRIEWGGLSEKDIGAYYKVVVSGNPKKASSTAGELFSTQDRNRFEILFLGNSPGQIFGALRFPYMEQNLERFQLRQESIKPFISFDFFRRSMADSNEIADLVSTVNASYSTIGGVLGAKVASSANTVVAIQPNLRSDMVRMIVARIYMAASAPAATLFELRGSGSYVEKLTLSSTEIGYSVDNGPGGSNSVAATIGSGATALSAGWHTVAVVFDKRATAADAPNEVSIGIRFYIDKRSYAITGTQSIRSVGSSGFKRVLQVNLVGGVLYERFHIYDKVFTLAPAPAPAGAEGFQTYVDTAQTSIDTILSQETDTDYSAEKRQMLASYAPGATYSRDDYTIDKALGPTVADPTVGCSVVAGPVVAGPTVAGPVVAGPTVAGPVVAGPVVAGPTVAPVCRIDIPPNMSPSGGSNNAYIAEQQIGYRFASPTQGDFTLQTGIFNLKTAFNMCSNNAKCVAFTFDSVKGELQQYEKIKERGSTEISTVPIFFNTQKTSDNIISVIMPGRDFTTNNMRIDAKNAIQSYIKNITTLQKENIYDKLFNTSLESSTSIDRLFGMAGSSLMELPREPRTLTECQGDLDSVDSVSDRRCLAALINKYSLSAPAPAPR